MSRAGAPFPEWLRDLQTRFGATLRTPIARGADGGPRTAPGRYDRTLVDEIAGAPALSAAEQLGVYNRQYWFRLFGALQNEYALTARLLSFPAFNEHAQRFLLARPPRGHDLHDAAQGFGDFLLRAVALDGEAHGLPREALREAVEVDVAFQRLLYAPAEPIYRPSPAEMEGLASRRLRRSARWAIVDEHWPLVELKRTLATHAGEVALPLPARSPAARAWLLCNTASGPLMVASLPEQAARLFKLLARHRVGDALARLERDCPPHGRAELPQAVRRWLGQSVELGFWIGIERPSAVHSKDENKEHHA